MSAIDFDDLLRGIERRKNIRLILKNTYSIEELQAPSKEQTESAIAVIRGMLAFDIENLHIGWRLVTSHTRSCHMPEEVVGLLHRLRELESDLSSSAEAFAIRQRSNLQECIEVINGPYPKNMGDILRDPQLCERLSAIDEKLAELCRSLVATRGESARQLFDDQAERRRVPQTYWWEYPHWYVCERAL